MEELYEYFYDKCRILENNLHVVQEKLDYIDMQKSQIDKRKDVSKIIDTNNSRNMFSPFKMEKKERKQPYSDQMREWDEKKEELMQRYVDYKEKLDYYQKKCEQVSLLQKNQGVGSGAASSSSVNQALELLDKSILPEMDRLKSKLEYVRNINAIDASRMKLEINQSLTALYSLDKKLKQCRQVLKEK